MNMKKDIFYKKPLIVIYVPGYLSGEDNQHEVCEQLQKFYKEAEDEYGPVWVVPHTWDSVASYAMALHNSYAAADDLIDRLKELPCDNHLAIVAHSLGALVVANAMKKIPFNAYYGAKQVILLGAAIDAHANLRHMCDVTEYPVINVVNPNDAILSTIYKTYNDSPALGCKGSYCKHPHNYIELEILPKSVKGIKGDTLGELANGLLDATGHSASRVYLDSLVNGTYKIR